MERSALSHRKLLNSMMVRAAKGLAVLLLAGLSATANAALVISPETWNIIGLDSNTPTLGPYRFPVGARVCNTGGTTQTVTATFNWGDANTTYINLRTGSPSSYSFDIAANSCGNAMFEVEVTRSASSYDQTRPYSITVGNASVGYVTTPTPRQLYVEHLVSQSRNGVTSVALNGSTVGFGGSMNLLVGSTYNITLNGFTATQGYEQLEAFINLPVVIFRINSIQTTFSADTSSSSFYDGIQTVSLGTAYAGPPSPNPYPLLYLNGCNWESDPNSPNYRACNDTGKAGGTVSVTYNVTILSNAATNGTSQTLNTLLHDFSGSSFHYNSDFSFSTVYGNIIDPTSATISKTFSPGTVAPSGSSTMVITLTNPNTGPIPNASFQDTFPSGMTVASPATSSTTCSGGIIENTSGGTLAAGNTGIQLRGATIPAGGSCSVSVNVSVPSTDSTSYTNTTGHLWVNGTTTVNSGTDTTKTASATLTVDSSYFPGPDPNPLCTSAPELVTLATIPLDTNLTSWTTDSGSGITLGSTGISTSGNSSTAFVSNHWEGTSGWNVTSGTLATSYTGSNPPGAYLQVDLNSTTKYNGITINYTRGGYPNNQWSGSGNNIGTYYQLNSSGNWTGNIQTLATGASLSLVANTAVSTGSSAVNANGNIKFRITTEGQKTSTATAILGVDQIVITGCKAVPKTPPSITKAFSPTTIATSGSSSTAYSTLTFTLTNPNAASALSGVRFIDGFPSGLVLYDTVTSNSCGGTLTDQNGSAFVAGTSSGVKLTGGALTSAGSCTVSVHVKAATAGTYNNTSGGTFSGVNGAAYSTESGVNSTSSGIASATLTVVAPPVVVKSFGTNPIASGSKSTLLITISNPNGSYSMSGVGIIDNFPSGVTVYSTPNASTTCSGGTLTNTGGTTLSSGNTGLKLTGATLSAGSSCTIQVDVTATVASTTTYTNNIDGTTNYVSHTINAATAKGNTTTADLTVNPVHPAISLLKSVSTSSSGPWSSYEAVNTGANVYYRLIVENTGDIANTTTVTDSLYSLSSCSWTLSGGSSWTNGTSLPLYDYATCVFNTSSPITASTGSHANTATAQGSASGCSVGSGSCYDTSTATYATIGLSLTKSSSQTLYKVAGDSISYSYLVSNTGAATLGTITVSDNKTTVTCPALSSQGNGDSFLNPGESITCTASYTVTASDVTAKSITNTAQATATYPDATSNTSQVTLPLAADLSVTKTDSVGGSIPLSASSVNFDWTLVLANSASSGSTASFADTTTVLTDDLPNTGPTYLVGSIKKAGATGTLNCTITTNTLTCKASGGAVTLPPGLTGTVAVTNGSVDVVGTGTTFTTQTEVGSKLVIAGVTYTVLSITDNTHLKLTASYAGATASGLSLPSTISVPVTVTVTAGGVYANPRSSGACSIDPGNLVTEISETNNSCSDTVTVTATSLIFLKSVQVISDPVNGTTNPKAIPGAVMEYTMTVTNTGTGTASNVKLGDVVPANMELYVCSDPPGCTNAVSPITFSCSTTPACGLTYSYSSNTSFSNSVGGTTYGYTTSADSEGYDNAVTGIQLAPQGTMAANNGTNNSSFSFKVRMRIK